MSLRRVFLTYMALMSLSAVANCDAADNAADEHFFREYIEPLMKQHSFGDASYEQIVDQLLVSRHFGEK